MVRNLPAAQGTRETQVQPLEDEYHLEEDMATYPSILAWEIPWTVESGRLLSTGSQESDAAEQLRAHMNAEWKNKTTEQRRSGAGAVREPSPRKAFPLHPVRAPALLWSEPCPRAMYGSLEWAFWSPSAKEPEALGTEDAPDLLNTGASPHPPSYELILEWSICLALANVSASQIWSVFNILSGPFNLTSSSDATWWLTNESQWRWSLSGQLSLVVSPFIWYTGHHPPGSVLLLLPIFVFGKSLDSFRVSGRNSSVPSSLPLPGFLVPRIFGGKVGDHCHWPEWSSSLLSYSATPPTSPNISSGEDSDRHPSQ